MLAPPVDAGGIGRYAGRLADHLREHGLRVDHHPLAAGENRVDAVRRAASADVVHLQFEYGLFRPRLVGAWPALSLLALLSWLRGTPLVVTVHEVWTPADVGWLAFVYVWLVHALLAAAATELVFMSDGAREEFRPLLAPAARVPHGVDVAATDAVDPATAKRSFGVDPGETVVSQIGYVSPRKGTEAFLGLAADRPALRFLLAGGPLRAEDERYFERVTSDVPPNVTVTGLLEDDAFHRAFAATDVAVLAYRDIRQSGILNWCLAYGVPAVCRAVDRFERLAAAGAPLVLFHESDGEHPSLDAALEEALADADDLGERMRGFGRDRDMASVAATYRDRYEHHLGR